MRTLGHLVSDIQKCSEEAEALDKHAAEASSLGLHDAWVRSVFRGKRPLPSLDLTYDVHGKGVDVLNAMGVSEEVQSTMWANWALLADDVKASWVQDFKKVDTSEPQDLLTYTTLLIQLLA